MSSSVLALDDSPLNAPMDESSSSPEILTFVTPGGRYTLPAKAVDFSPVLDQLVSMFPSRSEYNLVELLKIGPAREELEADGSTFKHPAHTLYNIPEEYYALVFKFFNQLHADNGVIPGMPGAEKLKELEGDDRLQVEAELRASLQTGKVNPFPQHCTIFDPTSSNVLPQAYWTLVSGWAKDPSLKNIGQFDLVALNFGNYALSKLNELAGAFWIAKQEDKLEGERHWIENIIERDVDMKVKERERNKANA